jgi:hypothetical protein
LTHAKTPTELKGKLQAMTLVRHCHLVMSDEGAIPLNLNV